MCLRVDGWFHVAFKGDTVSRIRVKDRMKGSQTNPSCRCLLKSLLTLSDRTKNRPRWLQGSDSS